jgi:DnaJ-class molecular chaperone
MLPPKLRNISKKIKIPKEINCLTCDGTKIDPETGEQCRDCGGTGKMKIINN